MRTGSFLSSLWLIEMTTGIPTPQSHTALVSEALYNENTGNKSFNVWWHRMTLITRVFYSTSTISAWLLEERRREHTSSCGAELGARVRMLLVTFTAGQKTKWRKRRQLIVHSFSNPPHSSNDLWAASWRNCTVVVSTTKCRPGTTHFVRKEIHLLTSWSIGKSLKQGFALRDVMQCFFFCWRSPSVQWPQRPLRGIDIVCFLCCSHIKSWYMDKHYRFNIIFHSLYFCKPALVSSQDRCKSSCTRQFPFYLCFKISLYNGLQFTLQNRVTSSKDLQVIHPQQIATLFRNMDTLSYSLRTLDSSIYIYTHTQLKWMR